MCRAGLECMNLVVQVARDGLKGKNQVGLVCTSLAVLVGLVYQLAEVDLLERR